MVYDCAAHFLHSDTDAAGCAADDLLLSNLRLAVAPHCALKLPDAAADCSPECSCCASVFDADLFPFLSKK